MLKTLKVCYFELMLEDLEITNHLRGGIYPVDARSIIERKGDGWRLPSTSELKYMQSLFQLKVGNFKRGYYLMEYKEGKDANVYDFHRSRISSASPKNTPCRIRLVRDL